MHPGKGERHRAHLALLRRAAGVEQAHAVGADRLAGHDPAIRTRLDREPARIDLPDVHERVLSDADEELDGAQVFAAEDRVQLRGCVILPVPRIERDPRRDRHPAPVEPVLGDGRAVEA